MTQNTVKHDKLDTYEYNDILEQSAKLEETVEEGQERLSTADKLSEDIFYSLYKNNVKKRDSDALDDGFEVNRDIIDKVTRSKQYDKLRVGSKLDKMTSALGTRSFMKNTLEEFSDEELEEMNDKADEAKKNQEEIEHLKDRLEGFEDADREDKSQEVKEKLEELKEKQKKVKDELDEKLKENTSKMRSIIRDSLEEAKKQSDEVEGMLTGWGMASAERQSMTWEEKMDLAEELQDNEKLQKIAEMIGRMKRLAISAQKQKISKVPEETQSITQGNDLSHVLPSELIHLDEETEVLFLKKYINRELLQYELEGNEPEAKGPIICCIDTSGSMEGDREIWAKGIAMGLYNIAKRQDRDFHVILFSTDVDYFEIKSKNISSGEEERENIMKMLKSFLGGGTDFNKAVNKALEVIEDVDDRCDIAFVTDGKARLSDDNIDKLEEQEELFIGGIGVGSNAGGLDDFADTVWMIEDILREGRDTAKDLFSMV